MSKSYSLSFFHKNLLLSVSIVLFISSILTAAQYYLQSEATTDLFKQQALGMGNVIVKTLHPEDVREVATAPLVTDHGQQKLMRQLDLLTRENDTLIRTYLFPSEIDKQSGLIILSAAPRSNAGLVPGSTYHPPQILLDAVGETLTNKRATTTNLYHNKTNDVISVLIPLADGDKVIAVFGADLDASLIEEYRIELLGKSLGLFILLAGIAMVIQTIIIRKLLSPVKDLINAFME
ncbi:hypothetical protein ACTID9_23935 [Brevibacillus fluminis]|uniref:hypothetical protein n=1 Tax=Brevibacillus fluminis TaxID=511487 RepID=UPI003F898165